MDVGILSSGGKDSTLAALLLDSMCEVTLLCGTFGITDDWEHANEAARAVGFPACKLSLDPEVAHDAAARIVSDGYPRHGIQQVHEHALSVAAQADYDAIADGTRRDDRVPRVERPLAQQIEDRHGVAYIAPLAGVGRQAVDTLTDDLLTVETGPSEAISKGDYETELRALIAREYGQETVQTLFPAHTQSRVVGRR